MSHIKISGFLFLPEHIPREADDSSPPCSTSSKIVPAVDFSGVMYYNYSIFEENFYCKNIKENCHENK